MEYTIRERSQEDLPLRIVMQGLRMEHRERMLQFKLKTNGKHFYLRTVIEHSESLIVPTGILWGCTFSRVIMHRFGRIWSKSTTRPMSRLKETYWNKTTEAPTKIFLQFWFTSALTTSEL